MNKQSLSKHNSKREKWAEGPEAVAVLWAGLDDGDYIEVRLAPVTHPIWLRDNDGAMEFRDANDDHISTEDTTCIITGASITGAVDKCDGYLCVDRTDGESLAITPAHVAAIRMTRGPTEITVETDDGAYDFVFAPDGIVTVNENTISRKDLIALYNAIGECIEGG